MRALRRAWSPRGSRWSRVDAEQLESEENPGRCAAGVSAVAALASSGGCGMDAPSAAIAGGGNAAGADRYAVVGSGRPVMGGWRQPGADQLGLATVTVVAWAYCPGPGLATARWPGQCPAAGRAEYPEPARYQWQSRCLEH